MARGRDVMRFSTQSAICRRDEVQVTAGRARARTIAEGQGEALVLSISPRCLSLYEYR